MCNVLHVKRVTCYMHVIRAYVLLIMPHATGVVYIRKLSSRSTYPLFLAYRLLRLRFPTKQLHVRTSQKILK